MALRLVLDASATHITSHHDPYARYYFRSVHANMVLCWSALRRSFTLKRFFDNADFASVSRKTTDFPYEERRAMGNGDVVCTA
jgi:hypothetical protein